jgi:hypothetical protein
MGGQRANVIIGQLMLILILLVGQFDQIYYLCSWMSMNLQLIVGGAEPFHHRIKFYNSIPSATAIATGILLHLLAVLWGTQMDPSLLLKHNASVSNGQDILFLFSCVLIMCTKVEEKCEGNRQRLHLEWRKIYPDSALDDQRVCQQLNFIKRNKFLLVAELEEIKMAVSEEIGRKSVHKRER